MNTLPAIAFAFGILWTDGTSSALCEVDCDGTIHECGTRDEIEDRVASLNASAMVNGWASRYSVVPLPFAIVAAPVRKARRVRRRPVRAPLTRETARGRYMLDRQYARALRHVVTLDRALDGMPLEFKAEAMAMTLRVQPFPASVRLSHLIEDAAADGTFAAAVFDVLAN